MQEIDVYSSLVGDFKKNSSGELIVVLFELCNLTCQACFQDHNSVIGIDQVREKFDIIAHALDTLKGREKDTVLVNIMGGELFSDQLPDSIFDDYIFLINKLRVYAKEINLDIRISFPSNMIWSKKERIKSFLDISKVGLNESYDPAGRFNKTTLEQFKTNITEFKEYIQAVGVVMTKPSINKFMSNNAPYFDYIYENFELNFDHYTHSERAKVKPEILMPKDTDFREFYKFMIDNYPRANPFCDTASPLQQPMSCMRTMYVFPDSSFGSCGSVEQIIKPIASVENRKVIKLVNISDSPLEKTIEATWHKEYDCLSCEHLQRCSMGCFLNNHFYNTRTQEACWLKEVYDFVDSRKSNA